MERAIIALVAACMLSSCAEFEVYDPATGRKLLHSQADMTNFTLQTKSIYVHADTVNVSAPMAVQAQAAAGIVTAVGTAAVGFGTVIR